MKREELRLFKDWWNEQDTGHACITDADIDKYISITPLPPAEGAEDLKQYMTNLLYSAYDKGAKQIEPPESERIELDKWVEEMINGIDEYFKSEQTTAEGAEEIDVTPPTDREITIAYSVLAYQYELSEDDVKTVLSNYTKPTSEDVEGAEEILDRLLRDYPWQHWGRENALKAMQEFATLHAQRLAEKMVEDELVAFLIKRDYPHAMQDECVMVMVRNIVSEYLKSRASHD